VKPRVLTLVVQAIVFAALVVPAAHAATPQYDGYKSGYPQLHRILSGPGEYDGYKSGYPQLHQILTYHSAATRYTAAPTVVSPGRSFAWRDAGIGLLAGVLGAVLIAATLTQLRRNRTTVHP
jgi:hypothetical protein